MLAAGALALLALFVWHSCRRARREMLRWRRSCAIGDAVWMLDPNRRPDWFRARAFIPFPKDRRL